MINKKLLKTVLFDYFYKMHIEIESNDMNFLLMGSFMKLIDKIDCLKCHIVVASFLLEMFRANLRFVNAKNNKDKTVQLVI